MASTHQYYKIYSNLEINQCLRKFIGRKLRVLLLNAVSLREIEQVVFV